MKKSLFLISSILLTLFTACSNLDIISTSSEYNIHGTLQIDDSAYRSAFPNLVTSTLSTCKTEVYYYKASETEASKKLLVATTYPSFDAKLQTGSWKLIVLSYTQASYNTDSKVLIFKSETPVSVTLTDENPTANIQLDLKVAQQNGNGTINLPVYVNSAQEIKLKCTLSKAGSTSIESDVITYSSASEKKLLIENVPCGNYTATLNFYDSTQTNILYSCTENIAVYTALSTSKWYKTGNSTYFGTDAQGKVRIAITDTLIDDFAPRTFCVNQNVTTSGNGTFFAPYKTLDEAIEKVNASAASSTYNIYVKDGYSSNYEGCEITRNTNISVYSQAPGDNLGTATLTYAQEDILGFNITSAVTFSLTGFTIDGKNQPSDNDGVGLNNQSGTVNLTNCTFKNCRTQNGSSASGGAILNSKIMTITNCTFLSNFANGDSGKGGGAISNSGNLTLIDSKFSGNTTNANGKGLYNNGTLTIKGTTWFNTNDDIYLNSGKFINLEEALTPKDINGISKTITASITSGAQTLNNSQILASTDKNIILSECGKFTILNSGNWIIVQGYGNENDLKKGILSEAIFVSGTSHSTFVGNGSSSGTGTKSNPFNTLKNAINAISSNNVTIFVDGIITEDSPIDNSTFNFTIQKSSGATTATCKYTGSGNFITTTKDLTVNDIIFDGGNSSSNRAFWVQNNTIVLNNTIIQNFKGNDGTSGIFLSASGKAQLKGTSSILNSSEGSGITSVVSTSTITLQDSVYLDSSSYIKLSNSGTNLVKINTTLTPKNSAGVAQDYAAIIKPYNYTVPSDNIISGTGLTTSLNKIKVLDNTNSISSQYYITLDGKLNKKETAEQLVALLTEAPSNASTIYIMDTKNELSKISTWVNDGNSLENINFKLNSDITIDSSWTPIGNQSNDKPFSGKFNGNNKTVTYDNASKGLFGYTYDASISNLNTTGSINTSSGYTGSVANSMKGGTISNCTSNTNITTTNRSDVGGIVGTAEFKEADRSCTIINCINTGNITSTTTDSIGGIAGTARSITIQNCYNSGNISGKYAVGGIAGWTSGNNSRTPGTLGTLYENCGNTGTITANSPDQDRTQKSGAGGIAGGNTSTNNEWKPEMKNCWSSGSISANSTNLRGGLYGSNSVYTLNNCYYKSGTAYGPVGLATSATGASTYSDNSTLVSNLNSWITDTTKYKQWKVSGSTVIFVD